MYVWAGPLHASLTGLDTLLHIVIVFTYSYRCYLSFQVVILYCVTATEISSPAIAVIVRCVSSMVAAVSFTVAHMPLGLLQARVHRACQSDDIIKQTTPTDLRLRGQVRTNCN